METPKLSPAKINPTKLLPGISISTKKISTESIQEESISVLKSDLFIIKKQVFKVRDLIQTSTLIKQSELEKKRKSTEKKGAEEQENKLEAKPEKKEGKLKMPSVPKLGFLDRIKNFLFSVLLGYISIKLLPHLPKLVGIVSIIGNVMEFMIDLGGNILDKVVTFIDWGYKAIDATRGFMKSFGGDFSLKIFDTFTGAVGGVIDAAIIAAIALSTQGMGGGGGPDGGRLRVGGKGAGRVDPGVARRYAERFGRDAALKKFGKEGVESLGGRYARSGATNLARKGLVGLAGKGGAKAILGFARPFLKRLPIIGALIDFGLSVALGEDPGRAAFKAIGAGLLGFVGAAIGGPFAILTGLAGGAAGDWAGGALYDAFFGGKKPKAQKPQAVKAAGGGPAPVTRGNKIVGGAVKRTISRRPVKRGVKVQVTKVKPGGSIGGKKKIEKIFPEVPTKDKGKNVNPLGYMQSSYNIATKTPSFGALFALPLKAQLGEKPSSVDYMKAAEELSGWMQNTFRGTAGYAGGGKVDAGIFGGDDTTNVIAKSLEENISSKVDAAIKELQKQLMLKEGERKSDDKKTGPDEGAGEATGDFAPGSVPGGQLTMEQLVGLAKGAGFPTNEAVIMAAIAKGESGGNSNAKNFKPPDKSYGLWQINMIGDLGPARMQEFGLQREDQLFDPVTNAKAAYAIRKSQGLSAWTIYQNGAYKNHLSAAEASKNAPSLRTSPTMTNMQPGAGTGGTYGMSAQGTKIAGDLGRYMYQTLRSGDDFSQVSEHPNFGGSFRRSYQSWHNVDRAVDIGGYWPKDQVKILAKVEEFNRKNNVKPVELLYGKPGTPESGSHGDHVHVAYAKGGRVLKPTLATLAEDGRPEFVFDADTTAGLDSMTPKLLDRLNLAETKPQLMKVLQSYMGGNTQISPTYGGMIKKPPQDNQIAATYGGAAAEKQQKIDAFMNQKGMPAGKGFQGRFDMFGREYDTNTGKLKQASNKPSQDTQIAATYGEGFPKKNFMDFLEKDYQKNLKNPIKNNTNDDSRPSRAHGLPLAQQTPSSSQITRILQSYAGYEDGAEQTVIVMNNPQMVPIPIPTGNSGSIGGMSRSSSIDTTYDIQYANA